MYPVLLAILNLSVPATAKMTSPVEEAIRALADCRVKLPEVVFQREAAAPVRLRAPEPVMSVEFKVMVPPIVAVAAYIFLHLKSEEPRSYVESVYGRMLDLT